jgi:hypothetical protein
MMVRILDGDAGCNQSDCSRAQDCLRYVGSRHRVLEGRQFCNGIAPDSQDCKEFLPKANQ